MKTIGRALACALLLALAPPALAAAEGGARPAGRLADAHSPYLRQHADNAVAWYPWGPEAFEKAEKENKPVFLSVGYSACHWCHVMERESFENEGIAALLNDKFVPVLVDRERRPDVDETYMLATQLIARTGGWPNNVFLTPDRKPFYGGTYFPPDAFRKLLEAIARLWETEQEALMQDGARMAKAISTIMTRRVEAQAVTPAALVLARDAMLEDFDELQGGFSGPLKFPQESTLLFLLHLAHRDGDARALEAVTLTLDHMLDGGIQDHAGGGFHRYAIDPQWRVPHFEKMLYNQALMSQVLLRAHRLTGRSRYAAAARRTLDHVLADLTAPGGGFYAALDADSEGEEGAFYVWTPEAVEKMLGREGARDARRIFGVTENGSFEGKSVLHFPKPPAELARELGLRESELMRRADRLRGRLAKARAARERPHRDDKIIAAWNGMMIAALAEGAEVLGVPRYRQAAVRAATFLWKHLMDRGVLMRAWYDGKAAPDGQQEDYAHAALAFIALYDLTGDAGWLRRAETLTGQMVIRFRDEQAGDFYMTASTETFGRAKARIDSGAPSGNAAALELFAKLTRRARTPVHRHNGEALLAALSGLALSSPASNPHALYAADLLLRGETGSRQYLAQGVVDARAALDPATERVRVRLAIARGWHVNASKPLEKDFIATELVVEGHEDAKISYPQPVLRKLAFHGRPLALYEGTVELKARLAKASEGRIALRLRLQACNDEICLEPETVLLTLPRRVGAGG